MRLSRWILLIGILVGVGCLQVAQRNALFLRGYAVGDRMRRLEKAGNDTSWLSAHVIGLSSPAHLAKVVDERQLKLVAWLRLPLGPPLMSVASTEISLREISQPGQSAGPDQIRLTLNGETSD